jgi:multiple sugar transport system permease protein
VYGVANYLLISVHIISQPVTFLNSPVSAFFSVVLVDSWKFVPFVTLIVLAGLRMVDRELYDAATVDGAGWFARIRRITIPLIRSALITAAIFRILQCFAVFDVVYVLTSGGPGTSTESVAMVMYNTLFESFDLSQGSAISTLSTLGILVICLAVLRVFRLQVSAGR